MEKKAYAVRDILDNSLNLIDRPEHSWLQFYVSLARVESSRMGTQVDFLPWNRSLPFNPKRLPKKSCPISFPFSTDMKKNGNPEGFLQRQRIFRAGNIRKSRKGKGGRKMTKVARITFVVMVAAFLLVSGTAWAETFRLTIGAGHPGGRLHLDHLDAGLHAGGSQEKSRSHDSPQDRVGGSLRRFDSQAGGSARGH